MKFCECSPSAAGNHIIASTVVINLCVAYLQVFFFSLFVVHIGDLLQFESSYNGKEIVLSCVGAELSKKIGFITIDAL